jgi:hypothetical protein
MVYSGVEACNPSSARGLNPYGTRRFYLSGTRRFYLSGTRRFYLYSLTECRSPDSPLLVPPLLRLGSVGVLRSETEY